MFAAKSTILLALFAASAQIVAAVPPACLLAAVNTEQNPADLPTICGVDSPKVQNQIKNLCGGNTDAALTAFYDVCKSAGVTVSSVSSSGSSSSSSSASAYSSSASASVSGAPYGTGNSTVVYTSTYFDTVCSCTKTTAISATGALGSSGFASATTGSGSGSGATGSPIVPSATASPSSTTSSPSAAKFTGAATKNLVSYAVVVVAVAGLAMAL
ncbi:hypothetical protein MMC12_002088 [Toensbergia leucococca]|nr:hypothetical protein [Toensbergia leucococca]